MTGPSAEKDRPRATVAEAVAAWEAKGPTSLTVALMAEALYGVHDAFSEFAGKHSAALHTIAQDPRDPDFADDWCALAALATTVQSRDLPPGGGDPDCDLCYPENHTDCTRKPYNGAAGHMITGTHRRCDRHSQQVTP